MNVIHTEKILMVDDDVKALSGYLRHLGGRYQVEVANGGAEGILKIKESGPYALVISDYRMPLVDGLAFLCAVKEISPDTVRIMLSGQAEMQTAIDGINKGSFFRFLIKPCSSETLILNIEEGLRQYRLIMAEKTLLGKALPVLPMTLKNLQQEILSPNPSIERVSELIAQDSALSARIRQLAGSAFFGKHLSVNHPMEIPLNLGLETISALSLHVHIYESILKTGSLAPQMLTELQTRSTRIADIAYYIAMKISSSPDTCKEAYASGLLCEIGKLMLSVTADSGSSCAVDYLHTGSSHAEIGSHLLLLWGAPPNIVYVVANHNRPSEADNKTADTVIAVHIAKSLLDISYEHSAPQGMDWDYVKLRGFVDHLPEWLDYALHCCQISPEKFQTLLETPINQDAWNPS